ncbi:hypothetical protein pb186bvf_014547 [Paramecium bursaria]
MKQNQLSFQQFPIQVSLCLDCCGTNFEHHTKVFHKMKTMKNLKLQASLKLKSDVISGLQQQLNRKGNNTDL